MKEIFDQLSPKSALTVGLVGGILTLSTIGFIIMLSLVLTGKINLSGKTDTPLANNQAAAPTPARAAPVAQAPTGEFPKITNADHIRGDKNAPLAWVEYSDFECPYCKRFHPTMLRMIDEFKGKIKWIYRHYPLSFHANAQKEAEAAECANELGGNDMFWSYTDKIFERTTTNGTGFALSALTPLAKELGLNEAKFQQCLDSGKYAKHVTDEMNAGSAAGVEGTPASFLVGKNGQAQFISGALPYEQIKAVIEAELNK